MFPLPKWKPEFSKIFEGIFDTWNEKKKSLHSREIVSLDNEGKKKAKVLFKEGEIWWVSLWQNIGSESYGKWEQFARPVYIFRKFSMEAFLGIPLTSQTKEGSWYHPYSLEWENGCLVLSQMRYFSAKRLLSKMTDIPELDEADITKAVRKLLRL